MGRVRTAAAKKYIEEEQCGSSNDENVAVSKRSARSKRGGSTANNNHSTARPSTGRTSRSTRQSTPVEKEKEKENGKNGIMNINVSDDSISEDEVVVNRKRKSSVENVIAKKQKASTSASSSAPALKTVGRPKKEKSSKKKKDKEDEEERYEVISMHSIQYRLKRNQKHTYELNGIFCRSKRSLTINSKTTANTSSFDGRATIPVWTAGRNHTISRVQVFWLNIMSW